MLHRVWYTMGMVSKSSAVRSIRLQNDIWEWLAAEAERRQTNVNGLVSDLLVVARLKAEERAASGAKIPEKLNEAEVATEPKRAGAKPAFKSRLKGEWKAP